MTERLYISSARARAAALMDRDRIIAATETALLSLLLGGIAGMSTFVFVQEQFAPAVIEPWYAIGPIVVAGLLNRLLSRNLRNGMLISFLAVALAFVINFTVWLAPLWLSGYPWFAINILLPILLGRSLLSVLIVLPLTYYSGYFGALFLMPSNRR